MNGVIGQVNTILKALYKKQYTNSPAQKNVTAIAFAGTVVGQLFFGWTSDHYSRKWSLLASTVLLFIFAALSAGSYGTGSVNSLLQALTAWRFLLGIGIGFVFTLRDHWTSVADVCEVVNTQLEVWPAPRALAN